MTNRWKTTTAVGLVSLTVAIPYGASAAAVWAERIKLKGDFRYRYEFIDEDGKDERHRNRLRLRLGIHSKVNDTVDVGAVLASGSENPISTNQTLDGQASTKDIRLDQAYFAWKPISGLMIKGGKLKNPFYVPVKSELLWDADLRPEGLALQYDNNQVFANAGFFHVEERKEDDDSFLFGGQVGYKAKFNGTQVTAGVGYFDHTEIENRPATDFSFLNGKSFGNSLDATTGNFINDYNELELFGDVKFKIGGMPLALFADYVVNTAADDNDTGYFAGFKVGKLNKPGSWDFRYNYHRVESDALFGVFADSNFVGGGTDGKGHELNFGYQIAKGWQFALTYFLNDKGLDNGHDYERVILDLKFKF